MKTSSFETAFYYKEYMPEKHASAETASSLNNERKYMTLYSKNYDEKKMFKNVPVMCCVKNINFIVLFLKLT